MLTVHSVADLMSMPRKNWWRF